MEYISPAGQSMPPPAITRHTHTPSLCSKWSDLRSWYCQCFISSPANWHFICIPASLKIEHLGEAATGSPAVVTSHSGTSLLVCKQGLRPTEAPPPTPSPRHQSLPSMDGEGALDACDTRLSISGPFLCWRAATWKTARPPWWIRRDRWVRREQRNNTIMFFRYEYKMTQLTGHTRFYFISQCIRPPYFVFFVLFSSACLHLILTAGRHLKHFRFKTRVSILDLSLKCKMPATTNIARVSAHPVVHTITHTGRWASFAL